MHIVYRRKGGISSKKWYKMVKKWKKSVDFTYLFRVCGFAQQNKMRTLVFFSHKYKKNNESYKE